MFSFNGALRLFAISILLGAAALAQQITVYSSGSVASSTAIFISRSWRM